MGLAVSLSLLAHVLALGFPMRERAGEREAAVSALNVPLAVRLALPERPAVAPVPEAPEPSGPRSLPVPPVRRAPQSPGPKPAIASASPAVDAAPLRVPEPVFVPTPQFDMAALIQANRERRRAAEAAALRSDGREPTAEEISVANLERNLRSVSRNDGTGGVFQIMRMGGQTAEFAFNGWQRERRGRWREFIEVQAGPDGDLERAVVRRMIALIREHYTDDFRWESHRLGRVLVLSAAPADNEGLEDFLQREFFGMPLAKRGP
jgi:hypothetical protein